MKTTITIFLILFVQMSTFSQETNSHRLDDNIIIEQPWNLENKIKALPIPGLGDPQVLEPFKVPGVDDEKSKSSTTISPEVAASIFENAAKSSALKKDPFANKYQDSHLTDKYIGKNVNYGDHRLDPKILEERYKLTEESSSSANMRVILMLVILGVGGFLLFKYGFKKDDSTPEAKQESIKNKYDLLVKKLSAHPQSVIKPLNNQELMIVSKGITTNVSFYLRENFSILEVECSADYGLSGSFNKKWVFSQIAPQEEMVKEIESYIMTRTLEMLKYPTTFIQDLSS